MHLRGGVEEEVGLPMLVCRAVCGEDQMVICVVTVFRAIAIVVDFCSSLPGIRRIFIAGLSFVAAVVLPLPLMPLPLLLS